MTPPRIRLQIMAWPRHVERAEYLERTLAGLDRFLSFGDLPVDRVVSSESVNCHTEAVRLQESGCARHGYRLAWRSGAPSVGGHVNDAIAAGPVWDWIFYCQEDHEPIAPIDVAGAMRLLQEHPEFLMARFFVTGRTSDPLPIPGFANWFELLPETAPYFWCHAPYLATHRMYQALGPFAQDRSEQVANRRAKALRFRIAMHQPNVFRHIGLVTNMPEKWAANLKGKAAREAAAK